MKKRIADWQTGEIFREEEGSPVCGEYCDRCGDCLHCDSEGPCFAEVEYPEHLWVEYVNRENDGREELS